MQTNLTIEHSSHNRQNRFLNMLLPLFAIIFTLSIIYVSVQLDPSTSESSLVEITQSLLIIFCAVICLQRYKKDKALNHCFLVMSYLFLVIFSREMDQVLEVFLPHGAWKVPAGLFFLIAATLTIKSHQKIREQLLAISNQNSFLILVIGCYILFILSRVAGIKEFWMGLMGDNYDGSIKTLIEESIELLGYSFISLGIFALKENRR